MCQKKRYRIEAIARDKRGRVISRGVNSYVRTHPLQSFFAQLVGEPYKVFIHAEIDAIVKAKDKTIHSLEVINNSSSLLPHPCLVCKKAIEVYKIKYLTLSSL